MSYIDKGRRFTYGVKTLLSDVSAIASPSAGETVFCSENKRMMTYDGYVWMCSDFVRLTNGSGGTLNTGDVVVVSTTTPGSVTTNLANYDNHVLGPIVFGNTNGNYVTVAISGIYNVNAQAYPPFSSDIRHGFQAFNWNQVAGRAVALPDQSYTGHFGTYVEYKAVASLTKCFLRTKIEYS